MHSVAHHVGVEIIAVSYRQKDSQGLLGACGNDRLMKVPCSARCLWIERPLLIDKSSRCGQHSVVQVCAIPCHRQRLLNLPELLPMAARPFGIARQFERCKWFLREAVLPPRCTRRMPLTSCRIPCLARVPERHRLRWRQGWQSLEGTRFWWIKLSRIRGMVRLGFPLGPSWTTINGRFCASACTAKECKP